MAVLGRSWSLCGRSGAEKCEEHSYLENVLISRAGARSAAWGSVLSCSWSLCCWSWAALGAYVGGLGLLLGPKLAVLGRLGAGEVGLGPKWSVLEGDQGGKVAQTRARRPFWGGDGFGICSVAGAFYAIYLVDIYIYRKNRYWAPRAFGASRAMPAMPAILAISAPGPKIANIGPKTAPRPTTCCLSTLRSPVHRKNRRKNTSTKHAARQLQVRSPSDLSTNRIALKR